MHVYLYTDTYIYNMYIHWYINVCIYIYMYIKIYTSVYMYTCIHVYKYLYIYLLITHMQNSSHVNNILICTCHICGIAGLIRGKLPPNTGLIFAENKNFPEFDKHRAQK